MAIIRKSELKSMNEQQLREKLVDLRKDMMKLKAQIAIGTTLESPRRPRAVKKTIARVLMMLAQKKRQAREAPVKVPEPAQKAASKMKKQQEVQKDRQ